MCVPNGVFITALFCAFFFFVCSLVQTPNSTLTNALLAEYKRIAAASSTPSEGTDVGYRNWIKENIRVANNSFLFLHSLYTRGNLTATSDSADLSSVYARVNVDALHGGWNYSEYFFNDLATIRTRTSDVLCDRGHYCNSGTQKPCPPGRYGASFGLPSAECTAQCKPGEYCPEGSITPTICSPGFYCPDGSIRLPCPPGTFGATRGLRSARCSGLCQSVSTCCCFV